MLLTSENGLAIRAAKIDSTVSKSQVTSTIGKRGCRHEFVCTLGEEQDICALDHGVMVLTPDENVARHGGDGRSTADGNSRAVMLYGTWDEVVRVVSDEAVRASVS